MNEKLTKVTDFFQKKNILFLAGICGILLIFLSDTLFATQKKPSAETSGGTEQYLAYLRQELEDSISRIDGAGAVKVVLTLEDGGTSNYAQDEKSSTETQTDGGIMTDRSSSRESEYVLSDGVPVLESSIEPSVKGVSVICEGGDDIKVIARITEFVSVGLGIPTNRICVTKMN